MIVTTCMAILYTENTKKQPPGLMLTNECNFVCTVVYFEPHGIRRATKDRHFPEDFLTR